MLKIVACLLALVGSIHAVRIENETGQTVQIVTKTAAGYMSHDLRPKSAYSHTNASEICAYYKNNKLVIPLEEESTFILTLDKDDELTYIRFTFSPDVHSALTTKPVADTKEESGVPALANIQQALVDAGIASSTSVSKSGSSSSESSHSSGRNTTEVRSVNASDDEGEEFSNRAVTPNTPNVSPLAVDGTGLHQNSPAILTRSNSAEEVVEKLTELCEVITNQQKVDQSSDELISIEGADHDSMDTEYDGEQINGEQPDTQVSHQADITFESDQDSSVADDQENEDDAAHAKSPTSGNDNEVNAAHSAPRKNVADSVTVESIRSRSESIVSDAEPKGQPHGLKATRFKVSWKKTVLTALCIAGAWKGYAMYKKRNSKQRSR